MSAHLFPFSIEHDCPINAQSYLQVSPEMRMEQKHKSLATLGTVVRGRRLVGLDIELPQSVQGHVWSEKEDDEQCKWTRQKDRRIERFVLWKKDTAPSDQDARLKAVKGWLDIAECIHEPIPLE